MHVSKPILLFCCLHGLSFSLLGEHARHTCKEGALVSQRYFIVGSQPSRKPQLPFLSFLQVRASLALTHSPCQTIAVSPTRPAAALPLMELPLTSRLPLGVLRSSVGGEPATSLKPVTTRPTCAPVGAAAQVHARE